MAELTAADIKVGRVYSAKRPRGVGFIEPLLNDRQVIYISVAGDLVQYDSPTVARGRKYPKVGMNEFLKWAKEDVTDQCPAAEWRSA